MYCENKDKRISIQHIAWIAIVAILAVTVSGCDDGTTPEEVIDDGETSAEDISGVWLGAYVSSQDEAGHANALVLELEQNDGTVEGVSNEGNVEGVVSDDDIVLTLESEGIETELSSETVVVDGTLSNGTILGEVTMEETGDSYSFTAGRGEDDARDEFVGRWESDDPTIPLKLYSDGTFDRTGGTLDGTSGSFAVSDELDPVEDTNYQVVALLADDAEDSPQIDAVIGDVETPDTAYLQVDDIELTRDPDIDTTFEVSNYDEFADALRDGELLTSDATVEILVTDNIDDYPDAAPLVYNGSADIEITGDTAADRPILDPNEQSSALVTTSEAARLTIQSLAFRNGYDDSLGAAVNSSGPMVIRDCLFENNESGADGGAVFGNSDVTISDSVFRDNAASYNGAAAAVFGDANVEVDNSEFIRNAVERYTGALYVQGDIVIRDSYFEDNGGSGTTGARADYTYRQDEDGNWEPDKEHDLRSESSTYVGGGASAISATGTLIAGDDANDMSGHSDSHWSDFDEFDFNIPSERTYEAANYEELAEKITSPDGPVADRVEIVITDDITFTEPLTPLGDFNLHFIGNTEIGEGLPEAGDVHRLDGGEESRLLLWKPEEPVELVFERLEITGGNSTGEENERGGAVLVGGGLTVRDSIVSNNFSPNRGGAFYLSGGENEPLLVENTLAHDNQSTLGDDEDGGRGGFAYSGGFATIRDSSFRSNYAALNGGVGQVAGAQIERSEFEDNGAWDGPGVLFSMSAPDSEKVGHVDISDSEFTGNTGEHVGAVYAQGAIDITDSHFENNLYTSDDYGYGAVNADQKYDQDGKPLVEFDLTLSGVTFSENKEPEYGAAGEVIEQSP